VKVLHNKRLNYLLIENACELHHGTVEKRKNLVLRQDEKDALQQVG
jgi:hypothetical protein